MEIGIIEAPTVRELFIQRITDMIIRGELKPGDRLPSERELAEQSHISKSAVHLAMSDLERMGFIETRERHGTYVCDFARRGNIETLNILLCSNGGSFDRAHTKDMLEMREAIEGRALERLVENYTKEADETLSKDVSYAESLVHGNDCDAAKLADAFFEFHHDICVCSGNFILPLIFNTFETVTLAYWEEAIRILGASKCIELMQQFLETLRKKDKKKSLAFLNKEFEIFLNQVRN